MAKKTKTGGSQIPHLWNGIPGVQIDNPSDNSVVKTGITCKVNKATGCGGRTKDY